MNHAQPNEPDGDRPTGNESSNEPAVDPRNLTPEEQMERYEQELKETDWGHQPC